jgi:putative two-component system response regulator
MDKRTILVIDDEPVILKTLSMALQNTYRIRALKSGKQAVQACKVDPRPDLVLLDIMMPEINGYEVLRQLKNDEECKDIPVIYVTARSDELDEKKGLDLGAVDYITKPIQPAIVLARVRTHIELKLARMHLEELVERRTKKLQDANRELKNTFLEIVKSFTFLIEQRDAALAGHSRRVAEKSRQVAVAMGITEQEVDDVFLAGLLSRIGTITLPDKMLAMPMHHLDKEERKDLIDHIIGAKILFLKIQTLKNVGLLIENQYEYFGGSGLPKGLVGEAIPLGARILAVVRDFDLLREGKLGHKEYSHYSAIEYIRRNSGNYYDPEVVKAYTTLFGHAGIPYTENLLEIGLADLVAGMDIVEVRLGDRVYVRNLEANEHIIEELLELQHEARESCHIIVKPHRMK